MLTALAGYLHRGVQRVPGDGIKIEVGKVQPFRTAVGDAFPGQIAVQVHLAKTDGMGGGIARRHRWHRANVAHVRDCRQAAHRHLDRAGKIWRIHGMSNVQRPQVAGDILAYAGIIQIFIKGRRGVDLQNFRAQVTHVNSPGNRIGAVDGIFKHDVGIAGLELNFCQPLEQFPGADPTFADPLVGDQLRIHLADGDIAKRLAVQALDVIG